MTSNKAAVQKRWVDKTQASGRKPVNLYLGEGDREHLDTLVQQCRVKRPSDMDQRKIGRAQVVTLLLKRHRQTGPLIELVTNQKFEIKQLTSLTKQLLGRARTAERRYESR